MDSQSEVYDVKITDAAWGQMIEHARFLAGVSEQSASKLVDDFLVGTDWLRKMPERCPWLIHDAILLQKYRKLFFGNYHMAVFEIRGDVVYVTAAVNCRQDYEWLL